MNITKKSIRAALILLLLSMFFISSAGAMATVFNGTAGDSVTYKLDTTTGKLTFSGKGVLDFSDAITFSGYLKFADYVKSIEIGEGITHIEDDSFYGMYNITSVKLPSSMDVIGYEAFAGCTKLKTINLPYGLLAIADDAFAECKSLTAAVIPDSVTYLGSGAFQACEGLTSVKVGTGLKSIPIGAFAGDISLTSVTLPETITSFEHAAFLKCSSLKTLYIPYKVSNIDYYQFYGCTSLTGFSVSSSSPFTVKDGILYSKDGTELILSPEGKTSAVVPEGVTKLRAFSFYNNTKLVSVKLPKSLKSFDRNFGYCSSLTSIDFGGVENIYNSFEYNTAMTSLNIPGSVKTMSDSFYCASSLASLTLGDGFESISNSFNTCNKLRSVRLPETSSSIIDSFRESAVTSLIIPAGASLTRSFEYNGSLTELFISEGVGSIADSFNYCGSLTEFTFPESLKSVSGFNYCQKLSKVYFKGDAPEASGFTALGSQSSSNATFFFLENKTGWTAPAWLKFKTAVWPLPEPSLKNFSTDKAVYTAGMFSDVNENSWYGENAKGVVGTAVRLGIMDGLGSGRFAPSGNITIAQAIKMAAVVNSIYNGGYETLTQGVPWYKVYVDYAITNGIIKYGDFADYNKTATRAEVAYIFAHAVPESELTELNDVKSIPDVAISDRYGDEIFLLYRAGVFQGNDAAGSFSPNKYITRAEAAAIISRVALPGNRIVSQ